MIAWEPENSARVELAKEMAIKEQGYKDSFYISGNEKYWMQRTSGRTLILRTNKILSKIKFKETIDDKTSCKDSFCICYFYIEKYLKNKINESNKVILIIC